MKNRVTSDSANPVNLFPFLAVLLCTMGALLVLLVVLADKAGRRVAREAQQSATDHSAPDSAPNLVRTALAPELTVVTTPALTPEEIAAAEAAELQARELRKQLEEQLNTARAHQQRLDKSHEKTQALLRNEQERLTHIEEHTRRLEHALAKMHIASEQLKAAEGNRTVDQQQAKRELARLKKLVEENETLVDEMRKHARGDKSYAITPYDGKSGTTDPRIFIECTRDGILLQPEQLEFVARDFLDEESPDSPIAAAVRATREHLRQTAIAAGELDPPYAVALLLVRPDGENNFYRVRAALEAAGESYGIEYLSSKGEIHYPVDVNFLLARDQQHAVSIARDQLERRIRSAPSRFRKKLQRIVTESIVQKQKQTRGGHLEPPMAGSSGQGNSVAGSSNAGSSGPGNNVSGNNVSGNNVSSNNVSSNNASSMDSVSGAAGPTGEDSSAGWATAQLAGGQNSGETGAGSTDRQIGALAGTGNSEDPSKAIAGQSETVGSSGGGDPLANSSTANGKAGGGAQASSGGAGSPGGSSASKQANTSGDSGATAQQKTGTQQAGGAEIDRYAATQSQNAEETAGPSGSDWAAPTQKRLAAVPLQRPIRVVIRTDRVAFLPGRGTEETGLEIFTQQTPKQIAKEIVAALKNRTDEWGIAGSDLYWKPVLMLSVAPDAAEAASRFTRLMQNSGVPIRATEVPQTSQRKARNATH